MDAGLYTFTLNIPPGFQEDLLAGRNPTIQLNVDATQVSQAFTGAGHIQQIINDEVTAFVKRYRANTALPVEAVVRTAFNPNLTRSWFGAVNEVINQITMLSIILTGAALIREREHGTIEHLLVMPVTPFEIMLAKVWAMGLVVLLASAFALRFYCRGLAADSDPGFADAICGWRSAASVCHHIHGYLLRHRGTLDAATGPADHSGADAATDSLRRHDHASMPQLVQNIMLAAPTTHFIELAQAILFRGAGVSVIWPQLLALVVIGAVFFVGALSRLRVSLRQPATTPRRAAPAARGLAAGQQPVFTSVTAVTRPPAPFGNFCIEGRSIVPTC